MKKVYIAEIKRSAVGKFLGSLSSVSPSDLLAQVIEKTLESVSLQKESVESVIIGNVLSAGNGQNIARQASLKAGIPETVPSFTTNMVCGSGLKTIMEAYNQVKLGIYDVVLAGGVESMSQANFVVKGETIRSGNKMGDMKLLDSILQDGLLDSLGGYHMGITAEKLVEQYNLTYEQQNEFAYSSQQKAIKADKEGKFKNEIVPIEVKTRKSTIVFEKDEYLNYDTNLDKLNSLRPAFKQDGTVTAGNSSGINDGACIAIIVSEDAIKKYNLKPLVEIIGIGEAGVLPEIMGLAPVYAIQKALKFADLTIDKIDLLELNEAFAAQSLAVVKQLSKDLGVSEESIFSKTNVNGGAIAIGHPLGASGARITATLIHEMIRTKAEYGLSSLCIGGGLGVATIVKRV